MSDVERPWLDRGIGHRFVDSWGIVIDALWRDAAFIEAKVGNCRQPKGMGHVCEGYLYALPPAEINRITWYEAVCSECGHSVVAPKGKVLPRSSRHGEMPDGAMGSRREKWRELFAAKEAA